MQDTTHRLQIPDKYSVINVISLYVNPLTNNKNAILTSLVNYIELLELAHNHKNLQIIIFADLNVKKLTLPKGYRIHT